MTQNLLDYAVQIGDYEWFPIKLIGNKYFVIAIKPLFKGYYSLEKCQFQESRICGFLNSRFVAFLVNSGIDAEMLSGVAIPTQGQYKLYIKDKLPKCGSYLLQTLAQKENSVLAVQENGEEAEVDIMAKYNIRPCMFIDAQYLEELAEHPIKTTESYFEQVKEEQAALKLQREAEAQRKAEEEAARIAAEAEAARIAAEEAEKARLAAEAEEKRLEEERRLAEEKARREAEERARQQALEEQRKREEAAKAEAERQRILEAQKREQEEAERIRLAKLLEEQRIEAERKAAEEARLKAERERQEAEEREKQRLAEEARKAAEEQRIKAEAEAKRKAEEARQAAEAARIAEEQKREADRLAAIKRQQEEEAERQRKAEEEKIRQEQEAAARISAVITEPVNQDIVLPENIKVEYDEEEEKKPEKEKTAAVYVYSGIYKDYAFLVADGDEQLMTSIEKMGLAIRDYMNSATNEARNPMQKKDVLKNIEALQNRWRW